MPTWNTTGPTYENMRVERPTFFRLARTRLNADSVPESLTGVKLILEDEKGSALLELGAAARRREGPGLDVVGRQRAGERLQEGREVGYFFRAEI